MDNLTNGFTEVDDDNQQRAGPDLERIRNARKRRIMQLKRWTQYDKAKEKEEVTRYKRGFPLSRKGPKSVRFSQNLILLEAGNHGDTEEVRRLLSEGVCADVANSDGLSALHQCAINKNIDMCRVLINYSANVNAKDKELWTPLHAAAVCGHTDVCLLLIRNGADLLAINTDGNMPYDICEDEVTLDAIENEMAASGITQEMINEARMIPERTMLHDLQIVVSKYGPAGALQTFSQLDKQGANCLHIAAACGYGDVTRYLVSLGMALDLPDRDGWLALHVAGLYNQLEVIEVLVTHGANIDALTKQGETVYELVYDKEMYDKLMLLKRETERLKDSQELLPSIGLVRRRSSNTNPRSASIRRTSMKEKSIISWKEARQEAELRLAPGASDNGSQGNHVEEVVRSSLRSRPEPIPEAEMIDLTDVAVTVAAPLLAPLSRDLRGSFTHPHPYNSPTRDPDTFPYTPRPPPPPSQAVARTTPRPATAPAPVPRPASRAPKSPRASNASSVPVPTPRTVPVAGSGHTTPIGSGRSSSQTSLPRGPPHDPRRGPPPPAAAATRYYKAPKHDSCCLLM